ncbi:Methyltransferase domain-containing protein [Monaibacterium marinum]|uniref:Methyltransferase domain-containing protein n=1 Tax=Pontivivens marinum TaxID=1690039 RepID=A0A2C9CQZ9_9RHOB|nr:class I SAM-dependent methyltransferase [Monaibacterium marinum]SOH92799.1 Methyltransferase domain-containing protein [Monaibacterium marinum]
MAGGRGIWVKEWLRGTIRDPKQHLQVRKSRYCPCCQRTGKFVSAKKTGPVEFRCPWCASRPRDRQIALLFERMDLDLESLRVLHFAPEWWLFRRLNGTPGYVGGDIIQRRNANAVVDATAISFADQSFDVLVCNHVLEHIPDDRLAMRECARVMTDDAIAIFTVPTEPGVVDTWEPPADMPVQQVEEICGWDHKRKYGYDMAIRLAEQGLHTRIVEMNDEARAQCRLFEEPIFLSARDPAKFDRLDLGSQISLRELA